MHSIEDLKQRLRDGDVEGLVAMLYQSGAEHCFRILGQNLLWNREFNDFERLLQIGPMLKDGEAHVLHLGLQLVPPGLPDSAWATPPLSELLEVGYNMVATTLANCPESSEIFHKVVVAWRDKVKRLEDQGPNHPRGWG
mgnify:CR=1 FL=1